MSDLDNFLTTLKEQVTNHSFPLLLCDAKLSLLATSEAAKGLLPALEQETSLWTVLPESDCEALLRLAQQQNGVVNNYPLSMPLSSLQANLMAMGAGDAQVFLLQLLPESQLPAFSTQEKRAASTLSDQNRAQISSIFGALFSLKRQIPQANLEPLQPYLSIINQSCYRLLRTCVNLSDFSRFSDASPLLHLQPLDFSALLQTLCQALQEVMPALTLHIQIQPDLCVLGDEKYLTNALLNLVGNSLKFHSGDLELNILLKASGDNALLTLADNGWGIPPQYLNRVCDPYFSYHPRGEFYSGIGLGLTNAKYIFSAHRGTLLLESQEGNGTQVTVSLPLLKSGDGPLSLATDGEQYLNDHFSSFHVLLSDLPDFIPTE